MYHKKNGFKIAKIYLSKTLNTINRVNYSGLLKNDAYVEEDDCNEDKELF